MFDMAKILLSVPEAAEAMGIGRTTLNKLLATGSLGSLKIGRRRLIFVDDVEEFVRKQVKDQASRPFAGEAQ